jgi:predicted hotdog family 3-hydroxylacyl-ACP dehydratase
MMNGDFPPVAELIPHQGRAVLIDKVLMDSEDRIRVTAFITSANPFYIANHGVPSWVGVELMAQAIAAHAGLKSRRSNRAPRIGMLLGTRRYKTWTPYFCEGTRLEISAQQEYGDTGEFAACACTILCEGQTLAKARLILIEIGPESMP